MEMDCDEGLVFHSVASDLIQDQPLSKVRTYTSQCSAVSNYCSALKVIHDSPHIVCEVHIYCPYAGVAVLDFECNKNFIICRVQGRPEETPG